MQENKRIRIVTVDNISITVPDNIKTVNIKFGSQTSPSDVTFIGTDAEQFNIKQNGTKNKYEYQDLELISPKHNNGEVTVFLNGVYVYNFELIAPNSTVKIDKQTYLRQLKLVAKECSIKDSYIANLTIEVENSSIDEAISIENSVINRKEIEKLNKNKVKVKKREEISNENNN